MKWINVGFENEEGIVKLIWECSNCGQEVYAGLYPPPIKCPHCKEELEVDDADSD